MSRNGGPRTGGVTLFLFVLLGGCAALEHGFMGAAGPVAAEQRELFWIVAAVLGFVAGPVLILTPIMAWHYRRSNANDAYRPNWNFSWTLEGFIWIPPAIIVAVLAVFLWVYTQRLDPYRPIPGAPPLEVQVIAADWKWLFIYPGSDVASVDKLVVPAGRPVRLSMTSATVMQSMMIPQLTGQIYTMAGMTTRLNLRVDKAGEFRGRNMQYNGRGFAQQSFAVVAIDQARFDRWLRDGAKAPRFRASLLTRRSTEARPQTYSHVPPRYFASVMEASGGHAHP